MTPKHESEVRAVLVDARAMLARRGGWCQGLATGRWDSHCAVGAVSLADVDRYGPSGFWAEAIDVLRQVAQTDDLVSWNDARGRRKPDVLAAFDCAIASLDA